MSEKIIAGSAFQSEGGRLSRREEAFRIERLGKLNDRREAARGIRKKSERAAALRAVADDYRRLNMIATCAQVLKEI